MWLLAQDQFYPMPELAPPSGSSSALPRASSSGGKRLPGSYMLPPQNSIRTLSPASASEQLGITTLHPRRKTHPSSGLHQRSRPLPIRISPPLRSAAPLTQSQLIPHASASRVRSASASSRTAHTSFHPLPPLDDNATSVARPLHNILPYLYTCTAPRLPNCHRKVPYPSRIRARLCSPGAVFLSPVQDDRRQNWDDESICLGMYTDDALAACACFVLLGIFLYPFLR